MNHLQGTLPPIFWKKLTSLQVIDVGDNQLKGTISDEPIDLEQLRKVRLYKNQFSGTLPDLSACTNLDDLELQKNNFQGNIPSWLGKLYMLSSLLLSSNRLLGSIPTSLVNLEKLQYLRLQDNDNLVDGSALEDICNKPDSNHPSIIVDCQIQCTCCEICLASSMAAATTASTTTVSTTRFNQGN
jgi:Leucine-rich repeat (LRR) protein